MENHHTFSAEQYGLPVFSKAAKWWPVAWFLGAVVGGICLTYYLSGIDSWLYVNNAQVISVVDQQENQSAASSIVSEVTDTRSLGTLWMARRRLQGK